MNSTYTSYVNGETVTLNHPLMLNIDLTKKQEVITEVSTGHHNDNLNTATSRVLEGATWKHQRIVVLIPAAKLVSAKVALSWMNLIFPPNQGRYNMLLLGYEVGDAYSVAIESVLANPELSKWEYILTLEHDNIPPADGVLKLVEAMDKHPEYACIGGLYWTKGEGGVPQIWGDVNDPVLNYRPQPPRAGEIVECYGTGMGFNLWRLNMFKDERMEKPFFKTLNGLEGQGVGTQDLAFWTKARGLGYRCAVDCRVPVGHYDSATDFTW